MVVPSFADVLLETGRALRTHGRVALCQVVRVEGSTPGKTGWKLVVTPDGQPFGNLGGGSFEAMVKADALDKLQQVRPQPEVKRYYLTEHATRGEATGMVCGGLAEVLIEVLSPEPVLVICGGGAVGQALAHGGALCDFEIVVAEDREEYRRAQLFPEATRVAAVDRDYSQDFLAEYADRELLVAVVTRCWETDLAAAAAVLRQRPARLTYFGLMGSQRKVERVKAELTAASGAAEGTAGVAASAGIPARAPIAEMFAPIGLAIGAESPSELAVSILAEIIQVRAKSTETAAQATVATATIGH